MYGLRFIVLVSLVMCFAPVVIAQDKASSPQTAVEIETLRKRIEEQEKQINLLLQSMKNQSELITQQQGQLEELKKRLEQTSANSSTNSTQASQPTANNAATSTTVKPDSKPIDKPTQSVESGFGKIKFNGLLQGWYSSGNGSFRDTFRLRRTELKFSGQITPQVKWTIMIDPSKGLSVNNTYTTINGARVVADTSVNQASRILQDAYITLNYIKKMRIDIGQYKVPLSMEGLQSSATLDTVERGLFMTDKARGGGLGDIRDLGVMISGPITKNFDYQLGFFNGGGENQNDVDKNDQKVVIGRLVVRPRFVKGLQLGASGAWGNGQRADRPRRDRLGGEVLYLNKSFKFKSELMGATDGDIHRLGYYTLFGYKLAPKLEAVFRFDSFDPDTRRETNSTNVTERDFILGFNYFINENNVKLQVNYVRKTFNNNIVPPRNLVLVNLQTSW